jgi:zinc transport system substrate-binding protein
MLPVMKSRSTLTILACTALLSGVVSGCSSPAHTAGAGVDVVASFYPLQFAVQQVGKNLVSSTSLTKPGGEPHDLELTPRDVTSVAQADLVVFEKGMAPAVDAAVSNEGQGHALDVAAEAHLDLTYTPIEGGVPNAGAAGTTDPHFWLDPIRYGQVAQGIADRLAKLDPKHRADYEKNAAAFRAKLSALDQEFRTGLASCARKDIVTSHNAFGYLARRYHLTQVGIAGLSPDAEPNPGQLARVSEYVKAHGVSTIYTETLVSPAIADTVARETGSRVAVLDPIEGLTSASAGHDYFEVMRSNLRALRAGQGCS